MFISYEWLQDYVALPLSPAEVAHQLTMIGLEVEGQSTYETIPGGLQGVVIGEVQACRPHPNADTLTLCDVAIGAEGPVQIVCGAPNVAAGQKVAVATVGSTLYPNGGEALKIKKSKIRGEVSQGMICAEDELNLGESHEGILELQTELPAGTPLTEHIPVAQDTIFEIGLTPNRSDAMAHYGVARDLAAALDVSLQRPALQDLQLNRNEQGIRVSVEAPERCPRYSGRVIRGVTVQESPRWLKQRLEAIGQRPINNIVDVTNYVLHGLGQPLHAFDYDRIEGQHVLVQTHPAGTSFQTLDQAEHQLAAEDLMISSKAGPMCMAGVMGGANSGTTTATTNLFLESAYFAPDTIRATVRRHGLHTETAYRFERGTDPNMTLFALDYATALIQQLAGGEALQAVDIKQEAFAYHEVRIRYDRLQLLFGKAVPVDEMRQILRRLEIIETPQADPNTAALLVPPYRADVRREQDIAEEILRIYGYNQVSIPGKVNATPDTAGTDTAYELQERLADFLSAKGLQEIYKNSLVSQAHASPDAVRMQNPLSEENAVLRQTLLFGGLDAIAYNMNRQAKALQLYEFGKRYWMDPQGQYQEEPMLGLWLAGRSGPLHWAQKARNADFFDLKGLIELLQEWLQLGGKFEPLNEATEGGYWAYGQTWRHKKRIYGHFGQVPIAYCEPRDLEVPVFFAELSWRALYEAWRQQQARYEPLPRFPAVTRDLSLELAPSVEYEQLRKTILNSNQKLIQDVALFDSYGPLENGNKSYALTITLQSPKKTLTEEEVQQVMDQVLADLQQDERVKLRAQ